MQAFWNANKTNNALKIGKENEMLMVVDTSLLPLNENYHVEVKEFQTQYIISLSSEKHFV